MGRLPGHVANEAETPAIYSDSLDFCFTHAVTGEEIGRWLSGFVTRLAGSSRANGQLVGHIKLYAEAEDGASWWVASTGGAATLEAKAANATTRVTGCSIGVTAILFGAEPARVRTSVLELLHDHCPGHLAL